MNIRSLLGGLGGNVVDDDRPTERTGNMLRAEVKYVVSGAVLETEPDVEVHDPDDRDEALLLLKRRVNARRWHGTASIRIRPTSGPARGRWTRTYTKDD